MARGWVHPLFPNIDTASAGVTKTLLRIQTHPGTSLKLHYLHLSISLLKSHKHIFSVSCARSLYIFICYFFKLTFKGKQTNPLGAHRTSTKTTTGSGKYSETFYSSCTFICMEMASHFVVE